MKDDFEKLRRQTGAARKFRRSKFKKLEEESGEIQAFLVQAKSMLVKTSVMHGSLGLHTLDILERVARIEQELKIRPRPARQGLSRSNSSSPLSVRL